MADLSIVIDPGGIANIRPGINLQVFPTGADAPLDPLESGTEVDRLSNLTLSTGGLDLRYTIEFSCVVEAADAPKLIGLLNYSKNARTLSQPWEVIIYNLVEPHVEEGLARTRFIVPSTNIISEEDLGTIANYKRFTYWVALQGSLQGSYRKVGPCYQFDLIFEEGTILTASQEI